MDTIIVILQIIVAKTAGEYYVSNYLSKWEEAGEKCDLAMPDINVTLEGYSAAIDYIPSQSEVWIGQFLKLTVFEYIGCAKIYRINRKYEAVNLTTKHISPGLCYYTCRGKDIVGISIDMCFCLDYVEEYFDYNMYCKSSCGSYNEDSVCGGKKFMSLYKVHKNESVVDRNKQCLTYERYGGKNVFSWSSCFDFFRTLCDNGTHIINVDDYSRSWRDSVDICITNGLHPASFQTLRSNQVETVHSWTGIISSDVIYTQKDWYRSSAGIQFGYITADKRVYFTAVDSVKHLLCTGEQPQTSPMFSTILTSILPTISTSGTPKTDKPSKVSTSGTTKTDKPPTVSTANTVSSAVIARQTSPGTHRTHSTAMNNNTHPSAENSAPVSNTNQVVDVTVVVVVATLAILALIATFVFLRKRRQLSNVCKGKAKPDNTTERNHDIPSPDEQPSYENVVGHKVYSSSSEQRDYYQLDDVQLREDAHTYSTYITCISENSPYVNTEY